jgi:hypothetical protein
MGVHDEDLVTFAILNNKGRYRFSVNLDRDGRIGLSEYGDNPDRDSNVDLLVEKDGSVLQVFFDNENNQRIALGVDDDGAANFTLYDKKKNAMFRKGD